MGTLFDRPGINKSTFDPMQIPLSFLHFLFFLSFFTTLSKRPCDRPAEGGPFFLFSLFPFPFPPFSSTDRFPMGGVSNERRRRRRRKRCFRSLSFPPLSRCLILAGRLHASGVWERRMGCSYVAYVITSTLQDLCKSCKFSSHITSKTIYFLILFLDLASCPFT